jgi:prolyl-tRNA synthetase
VGKGLADGLVELRDRRSGQRTDLAADDVFQHVFAAVRDVPVTS